MSATNLPLDLDYPRKGNAQAYAVAAKDSQSSGIQLGDTTAVDQSLPEAPCLLTNPVYDAG